MISNSTITNTTFDYNVTQLNVQDATIDRCSFKGLINNASISGNLTKCQFEKLSEGIVINGPLNDMTIQIDITPSSAHYVQSTEVLSQLIAIQQLSIDPQVVPRLAETLHKECFVNIVKPNDRDTFIVQLATDDTNPSGVILMFYPGVIQPPKTLQDVIPKGYAICDGSNGTPDLRGRFIRAAVDENDVNHYENSDLVTGTSGRNDSIQIKEENLPPHKHYFKLVNVPIDTSGLTISTYNGTYEKTLPYITGATGVSVKEGDGSGAYSGDDVTTDSLRISIDFTHTHSFSGSATVSGDATQDQTQEVYPNNKICIEPNSYALVFIMKL